MEAPSNAEVVTLQVGSTLRRTDKQQDSGLLLALVDTVTLNRKTATAVSSESNPGGAVQKPRTIDDDLPPTNIALPHDGLAYRFPFDTEKKTYPVFDPIAQKAYDANYDGEEDVNGLTTYRFTQNVGYDADGKLVEPVKYSSLYDDDADAEVTARASLWGLPGDPDEPITMTRYYAAQRTFWVDPVSGTIVKKQGARLPLLRARATRARGDVRRLHRHLQRGDRRVAGRQRARRARPAGAVGPHPADHVHRDRIGGAGRRCAAGLVQPARRVGADRSGSRRAPISGFFGRAWTRKRADARRRGPDREAARSATVRSASGQTRLITLSPPPASALFVAPAYALALSLVVTAPLLAPGYLLLRDAVSTPRSYLSDAALGLSEAAPRALPQDFAVALASHVVDGGVVVKALLVVGLWLAGWGAARLAATVLPEAGVAGQFVAVTIAIWNPYVAERLLQGHWSLLVGYGCLPWVATTMLRLRTSDASPWAGVCALVFWIALAGLTPTGLMLAATVAVACVFAPGSGRPRWWCAGVGLGAAVLAALPWLVAAAVAGSLSSSQAAGVAAFAARAEPGLGTLGSLASLGGIWNAEAVPASRTTLFAVVAAVVLLGVVAVGLPVVLRRTRRGAAADPRGGRGGGARRDGHRTRNGGRGGDDPDTARPRRGARRAEVGGAGGARLLASPARPPSSRCGTGCPAAATALVCCAALVATLPDLAWGVGGKVVAVHYPPGWAAVSRGDQRRPATCRGAARRQHAPASPGPVTPRCSIRCRAGCAPTC